MFEDASYLITHFTLICFVSFRLGGFDRLWYNQGWSRVAVDRGGRTVKVTRPIATVTACAAGALMTDSIV